MVLTTVNIFDNRTRASNADATLHCNKSTSGSPRRGR